MGHKGHRRRPAQHVCHHRAANAAASDDEATGLGGAVASWASKQGAKLKAESEAREKRERMALFAADLKLLGIEMDAAAELDERTLRKAFRDRSRELHPDVLAQKSPDEVAAGPSVYELNAAFEAVKKLL